MQVDGNEMIPLVESYRDIRLPLESMQSPRVGSRVRLSNGRCIAILETNLEQHAMLDLRWKSDFVRSRKKAPVG